ncbi:hypothetical protein WME89_07810 [Sorangium sp. So ce321]|uniref:hypothetical protein n=1 Tax=Sorangium sp. So ce321 TaxID=3133300 RepID=UPI003F622ACD
MTLVLDVDLRSRLTRYVAAVLGFCLSIFFAALAIGILAASIEAPPLLAWTLRGFILLLFGGIAVGSAVGAARALSGEDTKAHGVPPEVLARCLTCGEVTPSDAPCPACAEPPHDRAGAIKVTRQGILGAAFGVGLFGALVCLGVFILAGPYYDGERRVWALIAFGALGLLILIVGVAGLWGALGVLRGALGRTSSLSFSVHGPERTAWGAGASAWGKLVWLEGQGRVGAPPGPVAVPEGGYRASAGDVAFAEMIATLDAAGIVRIEDETTIEWRLGDKLAEGGPRLVRRTPLRFERKKTRDTTISLTREAARSPEDDDLDEVISVEALEGSSPAQEYVAIVGRFFARWLREPVSLVHLRHALDADPAHRAQAEAHARALRERGVPVSSELVEAILGRASDQPTFAKPTGVGTENRARGHVHSTRPRD